jgi:hypothetical protein
MRRVKKARKNNSLFPRDLVNLACFNPAGSKDEPGPIDDYISERRPVCVRIGYRVLPAHPGKSGFNTKHLLSSSYPASLKSSSFFPPLLVDQIPGPFPETDHEEHTVLAETISLCPFLPDLCPLPDHGADIAALHLAKAEQEAFLYTFRELVFGDG